MGLYKLNKKDKYGFEDVHKQVTGVVKKVKHEYSHEYAGISQHNSPRVYFELEETPGDVYCMTDFPWRINKGERIRTVHKGVRHSHLEIISRKGKPMNTFETYDIYNGRSFKNPFDK